jgi:hypothetical protein
VKFKIEKVKRQLFKPFKLTRYPGRRRMLELDSASTKRSSRESSKHKISPLTAPEYKSNISLLKVDPFQKPDDITNNALGAETGLYNLAKVQNEELKEEIQAFMMANPLDEPNDIQMSHEKVPRNFQLEYESLPSYHDEDEFNRAYEEYDTKAFRNRRISGGDELDVMQADQPSSFLFGNERETPNFEPFVTDKLFSKRFANDNIKS